MFLIVLSHAESFCYLFAEPFEINWPQTPNIKEANAPFILNQRSPQKQCLSLLCEQFFLKHFINKLSPNCFQLCAVRYVNHAKLMCVFTAQPNNPMLVRGVRPVTCILPLLLALLLIFEKLRLQIILVLWMNNCSQSQNLLHKKNTLFSHQACSFNMTPSSSSNARLALAVT